MSNGPLPDLICFSHLRWSFVFQRPQHLMSRLAARRRVFFVEEPIYDDGAARLRTERTPEGITLVVPYLPAGTSPEQATAIQTELLSWLARRERLDGCVAWYYTPMALAVTAGLRPGLVVYDCMDELSAFAGAPPEMAARERELFAQADLVFTGGRSLYESKRHQHHNVHLFPSSVDAAHFRRARARTVDPGDQARIARPRIGYVGVIDERVDLPLLAAIASLRPEWSLVMVGPVTKIDPRSLPAGDNVHYLGMKGYDELPRYLGGWDVAMLPFARNEATRFISPTKTPEYLAAGLPVVSTSITDVVRPYGTEGLVKIADTPEDFIVAATELLATDLGRHRARADAFLAGISWDETVARIERLVDAAISREEGDLAPEVA
jgi:glycosyltransferase involved in cell wall biosynthesis